MSGRKTGSSRAGSARSTSRPKSKALAERTNPMDGMNLTVTYCHPRTLAEIREAWRPSKIADLALLDDEPATFVVCAATSLLFAGETGPAIERHVLEILAAGAERL